MKTLLLLAFTCAALPAARAGEPGGAAAPALNYDYGMQQRKSGDHAGAKATFMSLLLQNPAGAGALEGLGLSCIALGQYEEAAVYLRQWDSVSPGNQYILGLLLRAQNGAGDDRGALETARKLSGLTPEDCPARRKAEAYAVSSAEGIFPAARAYRSLSIEDLSSGNPQRIIYEGSSAGLNFRKAVSDTLDITGAAELRTEVQRNDGRGFTYFELQEQLYTAGLAGRAGRSRWQAEYGQSVFSDVSTAGGGPVVMGRGRAYYSSGPSSLELASRPKLVRVSSGGRFYRLLRETSARAERSLQLAGWDWFGRAGAGSISGGRTLGSLFLRGNRDLGWSGLTVSYSHGQREFYNASASGRLRYVHTDRLGASMGRSRQKVYKASVYADQVYYSDSNRLLESGAEIAAWLPWRREISGGYRFSRLDFRKPLSGYDTLDESGHWLGAYWDRCFRRGLSAEAAYEHGYMKDSLLSYDVDLYTAGLAWQARGGSLRLQGRRRTTGGRGNSWSAGLQARMDF